MAEADITSSTRLAVIREAFAGLLALVVLTLFILLIIRARNKVTGAEFTAIKELLAIVNPTVGLIIGYYFSRVTSEARAERAEASAAAASRTAMDSAQAQVRSEIAAQRAQQDAAEKDRALSELVQAAEGEEGQLRRVGSRLQRAAQTQRLW